MHKLLELIREVIYKKIYIVMFFVIVFLLVLVCSSDAYFGFSGLGLFGSSFYGGLFWPYGFGGLYGMSGLYGGINSLYGLNGLYGLGGMYGLYGLSYPYYQGGMMGGLGSLLGFSSMCPGFCGLGGPLASIGLLSNLGIMGGSPTGINQKTAPIAAEQAGTWSGTWTSLITLKGGIMQMSLIEDVLTGTLSGQVNLLLNTVTNSIPADVVGYISTLGPGSLGITGTGGAISTFILSGGNQSFFSSTLLLFLPSLPSVITVYTIDLVCVMTSPVTIIGTYEVADIYKLKVDSGEFNLTLTSPVI